MLLTFTVTLLPHSSVKISPYRHHIKFINIYKANIFPFRQLRHNCPWFLLDYMNIDTALCSISVISNEYAYLYLWNTLGIFFSNVIFMGHIHMIIKSHYNYMLLLPVCCSGWGLSLHGNLESAWDAVGTEAPVSKVELHVYETAVSQMIKDTCNSKL